MPRNNLHCRFTPFHVLAITLEFTETTRLPFFHRGQITGFIRSLIDQRGTQYAGNLLLETTEDGRIHYKPGDHYCFGITVTESGMPLLRRLLPRLQNLPHSLPGKPRRNHPFRDNLRLISIVDRLAPSGKFDPDHLTPYDMDHWHHEMRLWRSYINENNLVWRWRSPVRMMLPADIRQQREANDSKSRYCSNPQDLNAVFLLKRNLQAFLPPHTPKSAIPEFPDIDFIDQRLFWAEDSYKSGAVWKQLGGMLGEIRLPPMPDLPEQQLAAMVLGQHLGMGEQTAFGLGRYRLETESGETAGIVPYLTPARSILDMAVAEDNLREAWRIASTRGKKRQRLLSDKNHRWLRHRLLDPNTATEPLELRQIPKNDGTPRTLAIPPFLERVAQRALIQTLTPALDRYFHRNSHGYRKGRSRHTAGEAIHQAWKDGYRHVFESDIEDFFTSVEWRDIEVRLRSLYGHDPVVNRCMAWIMAPVSDNGNHYPRQRGLPQGAPLSPVLANLVLDDFDRDLASKGFKGSG